MKRWLTIAVEVILFGILILTISMLAYGCLGGGNTGVDTSSDSSRTIGDIKAGGDVTTVYQTGMEWSDFGKLAGLGWLWHHLRARRMVRVADTIAKDIERLRPETPEARHKTKPDALAVEHLPPIERLVACLNEKQGPEWSWFARRVKKVTHEPT